MGTTSSAVSSLLPGTSTFNGTSQYAADLQQAINHAVTIASIPLTELQTNLGTLQGQTSEVGTMQSDFTAIQTSLQNLATASGGNSFAASAADNTVASVSLNSSAAVTAGTYDVNVLSAGSQTNTLSNAGLPTVSDPSASSISTSGSYTLSVNGTNYTVTPGSNTLNALAQAINQSGAAVNATIVNIGAPSSPDYRLSLQSTALGNVAIQLNDGTQNLLSTLTTGTDAQYQVDGQPSTPISSDSSTVTIAPGVTVNLLKAGDTEVTVSPDSSATSNALSAFATAYNNAVTELGNNHGTAGGSLTGQSIVFDLEQSLRSVLNYTSGSGNVQNLTSLGLTFNSNGQLEFNQGQFESISATDPNDVAAFLGTAGSDSTPGTGFLGTAVGILNGLEDPINGVFAQTSNSLNRQINSDSQEITDTQNRITTMQNTLTAQMTAADAQIALLESQVTYFTGLFTATQDAIQSHG